MNTVGLLLQQGKVSTGLLGEIENKLVDEHMLPFHQVLSSQNNDLIFTEDIKLETYIEQEGLKGQEIDSLFSFIEETIETDEKGLIQILRQLLEQIQNNETTDDIDQLTTYVDLNLIIEELQLRIDGQLFRKDDTQMMQFIERIAEKLLTTDLVNVSLEALHQLIEETVTIRENVEHTNTKKLQLQDQTSTLLENLSAEKGHVEISSDVLKDLLKEFIVIDHGKNNDIVKPLNSEQKVSSFPILDQLNVDQAVIQQQFASLYKEAESLLGKLTDETSIHTVSPKILELLEKWSTLELTLGKSLNHTISLTEEESTENSLWTKLVAAYQKRNQLVNHQRYARNAQVTSKDITKWLQNSLNVQTINEVNITNATSAVYANDQATPNIFPMSQIEQYIIHMNQSEGAEPIDKQFMDQFQTAMKTSRFLSMNNGTNQLSIALRPDNLGEMMVRLTEVNGEMTLKIIVNSQSTRQMLEANIHQLKNMFSPHQVVIEEQEGTLQETQAAEEEHSFNEHEEEQSDESNKDEQKEMQGDFETKFHEVLMNEKV